MVVVVVVVVGVVVREVGGGGSDSGSFGVAMKLCGGEFDGSILRSV